jgi:hypothetical protein
MACLYSDNQCAVTLASTGPFPTRRRKNLEDAVPIFQRAAGYQNVTLSALAGLLQSQEDIWLLAFAREGDASSTSEQCTTSLQRFRNLTAELSAMVKIGLMLRSDADCKDCDAASLQADECAAPHYNIAAALMHDSKQTRPAVWWLRHRVQLSSVVDSCGAQQRQTTHACHQYAIVVLLRVQMPLAAEAEAVWR